MSGLTVDGVLFLVSFLPHSLGGRYLLLPITLQVNLSTFSVWSCAAASFTAASSPAIFFLLSIPPPDLNCKDRHNGVKDRCPTAENNKISA